MFKFDPIDFEKGKRKKLITSRYIEIYITKKIPPCSNFYSELSLNPSEQSCRNIESK